MPNYVFSLHVIGYCTLSSTTMLYTWSRWVLPYICTFLFAKTLDSSLSFTSLVCLVEIRVVQSILRVPVAENIIMAQQTLSAIA